MVVVKHRKFRHILRQNLFWICFIGLFLQLWGQFHQQFMSSFYPHRSQKWKKDEQLDCLFLALLGSGHVKAVHRTLMKWTPDLFKNYLFLSKTKVFKCETTSYVKSTGENVCAITLPMKANFSKAIDLCSAIGAKLPEIFAAFDQRSIERRKVKHDNL